MEQRSLFNMHSLLIRCIEACSFLCILMDNQFTQITQRYQARQPPSLIHSFIHLLILYDSLPVELQSRLGNLRFRDLVSSMEGVLVSQELVTALIRVATTTNSTTNNNNNNTTTVSFQPFPFVISHLTNIQFLIIVLLLILLPLLLLLPYSLGWQDCVAVERTMPRFLQWSRSITTERVWILSSSSSCRPSPRTIGITR